MYARIALLAIAMLWNTSSPAAEPRTWRLASEQDGIQVYLSPVPDSRYQSFRGVTRIQASISTLSDLQENLRVACSWLYACKEMRLLKNDGDDTWVYLTTTLPWPAEPRDMVLQVHSERRDDGSLVRTLTAVPGWVAGDPAFIRVRQALGTWSMVPKGTQVTEVTYEMQAEPAGEIPSWLANQFVLDAPLVTLKTLRTVAERQTAAANQSAP